MLNKKFLVIALIAVTAFLFAGKTAETTYVGFNGNTTDEIKTAFANNSVSFVIYTTTGFDKAAFSKKADIYSKMFSLTSETVSNNTTYSVKFNEGFKDMKYLMRLFVSAGINEIHFGTEVMSTDKFFAQFNTTASEK